MLVLGGRRERVELLSCWVLLCKVIGAVSLVPRGYFCFATDSFLFLLTLREEGCGGKKEMLMLAFLPWKQKIRNGVMGKGPLSLLALHRGKIGDCRRVGSMILVGAEQVISFYRFCTPEGILGCYWSPSRPLHAVPYRDVAAPAPCPAASQRPRGSLQLGTKGMLAVCIPASSRTSTSPSFCHQEFLIIEVQETWEFLSQC